MELKKAKREQTKMRLSLASPSGFGKTTGALMIAYGMTGSWDKIAVIDTEHKSASLYSNHKFNTGFTVGEFNTIQISPPFTPEKYIEAIKSCENAGMEVIIIDSITHVWNGQGGLLEYKDSLGGNFQNWAKVTPRYQAWLSSILESKCHVITTNRQKQAYNLTTDNNKTKVEKAGMDDQIRDGYEYEMTVSFVIVNDKFLAKPSKDRSGLFMGNPEFVITSETGEKILEWCNSGSAPETSTGPIKSEEELIDEACFALKLCTNLNELANTWKLIGREMQEKDLCKKAKEDLKASFNKLNVA